MRNFLFIAMTPPIVLAFIPAQASRLAPRTGARLVVRQYPSARVHGDRGRVAASAFEAADFGLERYAEAVAHSRSHEPGEGEDVG